MSQWARANLWRALTRPEYHFEVEELRSDAGEQMIFVHLNVFEWSKSTLKQLHSDFEVFRELIDVPLYCTSPIADDKWQRFITRFGWKPLVDNGEHRLFISLKDDTHGRPRHVERNQEHADGPLG